MKRIAILSLSVMLVGNLQGMNYQIYMRPSQSAIETSPSEMLISTAGFISFFAIVYLCEKYGNSNRLLHMNLPEFEDMTFCDQDDEDICTKALIDKPAVAPVSAAVTLHKPVKKLKMVQMIEKLQKSIPEKPKRSAEQTNKEIFDYLTSTC